VFKKDGSNGWTDLYYDNTVITKKTTYNLTLESVNSDRSGLVFGLFSKDTMNPDLS